MTPRTRRGFLADVGRGMLVASLGPVIASELGVGPAYADGSKRLTFGNLEPLVGLLQDTPADKLLPVLTAKLKDGTELRTLVAAGALANARTFGGHDYDGYHSFMALAPSYHMSKEMPADKQALPVLKVLYRNTSRMQAFGGSAKEQLHEIEPIDLPADKNTGETLQQATRSGDLQKADRTFAAMARGPIGEAFNHLQFSVEDEVDVHRVVLSWRAWSTLSLTGPEHAYTLLRQSVHYCIDSECRDHKSNRQPSEIRTLLPKLLDQYKLAGKKPGDRKADDAWVQHFAEVVLREGRSRAAEAAAAALAEGIRVEDVGEAISMAANLLVLHDPGRVRAEPGKPVGSVHGASVGVHASDSANAWRNIARVGDTRTTVASMIVGAFHTAGQYPGKAHQPYPLPEHLEKVRATDPAALLTELEDAVRQRDQGRACAIVHQYGKQGHAAEPVFAALLRYGVSEDGALHAEKYYRTVREEFKATRAAFRWSQLVALARVTASEYGNRAPGYAEACKLLGV